MKKKKTDGIDEAVKEFFDIDSILYEKHSKELKRLSRQERLIREELSKTKDLKKMGECSDKLKQATNEIAHHKNIIEKTFDNFINFLAMKGIKADPEEIKAKYSQAAKDALGEYPEQNKNTIYNIIDEILLERVKRYTTKDWLKDSEIDKIVSEARTRILETTERNIEHFLDKKIDVSNPAELKNQNEDYNSKLYEISILNKIIDEVLPIVDSRFERILNEKNENYNEDIENLFHSIPNVEEINRIYLYATYFTNLDNLSYIEGLNKAVEIYYSDNPKDIIDLQNSYKTWRSKNKEIVQEVINIAVLVKTN